MDSYGSIKETWRCIICGIAGVVRWGNKPINEEQVGMLLVDNEHRGNDASGIVIQQEDGALDILKKDVPGWQLVTSNEYEKFIQERLVETTRSVLVHSRGASQGTPRNNNNNHPMFAGKSAIIHNGVIRNDAALFNKLHLERKAETDSDVIRAIIDKWGMTEEAIEHLGEMTGSGAIAAVHLDYPDKLLLIRSGNPLTLGSNDDFFFFSSEKTTLHKACRPFVERKGMWFQAQKPDVDFTNMENDSAWLLGPDGLERHERCKICMGEYTEPWRKVYEEYGERQRKWDARTKVGHESKEMREAWCHKCNRLWWIPTEGLALDYFCNTMKKGCGQRLWSTPPKEKGTSILGIRVN